MQRDGIDYDFYYEGDIDRHDDVFPEEEAESIETALWILNFAARGTPLATPLQIISHAIDTEFQLLNMITL